ncbi:hypothetical protein [Streptomyces sp. NBC_00306]|uniref:hypothetical protein n=1 Tax=Streptomyces sp. NBC_00306 TaxID=2975708 RepID=UPI002E29D095|nr:hypothetical protein [Streptomyces sp. NBC_00306]
MRLLRRLAALATVLALSWVFAPSAVAGGPTSVLVTSPESGETASLYSSNAEYGSLLKLLGEGPTKGQTDRPPSLDMALGTRQITVTWMIHDVQPWRVDQVYPGDRAGLVWIHTATNLETRQGYWHQARQPAELTALFTKLGLMGEKNGGAGVAQFPPARDGEQQPAPGPAEEPAEEAAGAGSAAAPTAAARTSDGTEGWWWAIPGLVGGAVLALVLRPVVSRLRRPPFGRGDGTRETGPRQQLLDG